MSVYVRIRNGMMPDGEGNGGASEGDIRGNSSDFIEASGVVDHANGHLLVTEAAVPAMSVLVASGVGYIPNTAFDETDSDSIKFWEAVVAGVDGERTLVIGANSSGQVRIDLICLKIDTGASPDYYASDVAELIVVAGTPGAGVPATPDYHLTLARVTVANGETAIQNADITDVRVQAVFKDEFIATTVVREATTQTLTNKRITKRVATATSSTTPTPNADTTDQYQLTALAAGATFGEPTGTPTNGQGLVIRIEDNGTARSLAWNAVYRAIGVVLPTTTVLGKVLYVGFIYNSTDDKWDCVAVQQEL